MKFNLFLKKKEVLLYIRNILSNELYTRFLLVNYNLYRR